MLQTQLNAMLAVVHQLPAIVKELKKANELKALELRLKALELRLKTQYEWCPPTSIEDMNKLADIMKKAE